MTFIIYLKYYIHITNPNVKDSVNPNLILSLISLIHSLLFIPLIHSSYSLLPIHYVIFTTSYSLQTSLLRTLLRLILILVLILLTVIVIFNTLMPLVYRT